MTSPRLVFGLALASLVPTLALPVDWPAALEPLARVDRVGWFTAVVLLVASAPGGATRVRWWCVPLVFAPLAGLVVALDGAPLAAALALGVATFAARARAQSRPAVWATAWWLVFAAPVLVAYAFGTASGAGQEGADRGLFAPDLFARAFELSPFAIARGPWLGVAQDYAGAALGAAAALIAPLVATRRAAHESGEAAA